MQMLREQLDPSVEFREEVQARHVNLGVISKHVAFKGIGLNEVFEGGSIEKRGGPIAEFWDISTCQRQGITDDQQSGGGGGACNHRVVCWKPSEERIPRRGK